MNSGFLSKKFWIRSFSTGQSGGAKWAIKAFSDATHSLLLKLQRVCNKLLRSIMYFPSIAPPFNWSLMAACSNWFSKHQLFFHALPFVTLRKNSRTVGVLRKSSTPALSILSVRGQLNKKSFPGYASKYNSNVLFISTKTASVSTQNNSLLSPKYFNIAWILFHTRWHGACLWKPKVSSI